MLFLILLTAIQGWTADVRETQFDILGYSPELNVYFAQRYDVPDSGKCASYILDLDKKTKFTLPTVPGVGEAVLGAGGDEEAASCYTREFEGQLEIKLKTGKTYSAEEKARADELSRADWKRPLPGYKDATVPSLGGWLRAHRPKWHPELAAKLYETGVSAAEDKDWLDGFSALVISSDWKPGYSTKAGRARAEKLVIQAEKMSGNKGDKVAGAKAILALETAVRLDPKNARAWLDLAELGRGGFDRAGRLVAKALTLDPVMATRAFRESEGFYSLRCDKKAESARRALPAELVKDLNCGP